MSLCLQSPVSSPLVVSGLRLYGGANISASVQVVFFAVVITAHFSCWDHLVHLSSFMHGLGGRLVWLGITYYHDPYQ